MTAPSTDYLHTLARQLHLEPTQEQEIITELQSHIEDTATDLEAQGMDREAALTLAAQQLGSPAEVSRRMYAVHSPGVWRDVVLATLPHFLLAALFALNLWSHYFLVTLLLIGISLVTWKNWRAGNPSKWSYSWFGYTLAAPALSWLLALITLAYGGWTLITTGELPFSTIFFFLLIGYVPFSMWIVVRAVSKAVRRDWLLVSLTALPFPFLTSWVLFLNWQGGLWSPPTERMQESDTARALIFLALAVTTAVFLKLGSRLVKIGLLTVSTAILVIATAASLPISFNLLAVLLMILASVAFLLSPAMLESKLSHRDSQYPRDDSGGDAVTDWFTNTT